jgi:hypothetical protein
MMNKLTQKFTQMPKDPYERIIRLLLIGQTIIVIYMMIVVINRGINEGRASGTTTGLISSVFTSVAVAILIAVFFGAINIGFQWWENLSEWLENEFKLLPAYRRAIIALSVASTPLVLYWVVSNIHFNISVKIFLVIWYGLIFSAAVVSLARADKAMYNSPLTKYVSREVFARDQQAAVAKVFTVVEDRLKKKIGSTENFSTRLINEAYQGENSKLMLMVDGKDKTSQLRDMLSGAYSLLRNPGHHSLVEDDESTAFSLYAIAGLLLHFVEASEPRNKTDTY